MCGELRMEFNVPSSVCRGSSLAVLILIVTLGLSVDLFAQTRRVMSPGDVLRVAGVSDAQISPNGEWIV